MTRAEPSPHTRLGVALLASFLVSGCVAPDRDGQPAADLVLSNGRLVTVDPSNPEAEAMAVRGDRIIALGSTEDMAQFIGPATEVLDLEGRLAIPGFIESHGHFMGVGDANMQLRLMDTDSWDEIVAMVMEAVGQAGPGQLIRGRGWHQEKWSTTPEGAVDGLPVHHSLSAVSPNNPVILRHASGHATYANARAMEMSGIDRNTPDPPGGQIVRDADGTPIGVFRETASRLLRPASEGAAPPDPRRLVQLAQEEALRKGITSFHDAGTSIGTVDLYRELAEAGELDIRLWVMLRGSNEQFAAELPNYRLIGVGNNHLTVRAIKHSIDGALGPHGAWLLDPYEDLPSSAGLNTTEIDVIEETARLAALHGYQLAVHAIGDRANQETLDIFQATFEANPDLSDLRWRIEHAQHLAAEDIPRFAEMGVIASMEGIHATSDAPYVLERLGEVRAEEGAYVWQKLLQSGAVVTNGTDAPVEDVDPIPSYYATVSRRTKDGSVFFPEQRMSRMEALESYTLAGAYAAFEEDLKGSLTVGKLADVTVLSVDILEVPEEEIPEARVLYTIVGGVVKYRAGEG